MVLYQWIHRRAVGGETGNHVGFADDELSVQDIVISVVAAVNDKGEIHHHSGGVAMAVGAGVGLVGRYAVVGQKLCFALSVDDDASAGAFHICGDVNPATDEVNLIVLHGVGVDRDGRWQDRPVGVLREFPATREKGQKSY